MRRIANTGDAIGMERLARRDCLVVMEATGCYDAVLRTALGHADVRHARVNPAQARHFAQATGRRAKTDAVDARMLAELGQNLAIRVEPPADPERRHLASLSRRDQLVVVRKQEPRATGARHGGAGHRALRHRPRPIPPPPPRRRKAPRTRPRRARQEAADDAQRNPQAANPFTITT